MLAPWKSEPTTHKPPRVTGLYTSEQMRAALERERARSDRSGAVFSLVSFAPGRGGSVDDLDPLVSILRRRLRVTDELGWLDEGRLGALLPETLPAMAWKVADDVVGGLPAGTPRPRVEVFSYPSQATGRAQPEARSDDAPAGPRPAPDAAAGANRLEPFFAERLPWWKRAIDIAGALLALAIFSPAFVLATVAIKLFSPGPVIFKQRRMGLGGSIFTIYKFRTMAVDAETRKAELRSRSEQDGPAFKMTNDPRVTLVGRILRKTSMDELPQLWNVLKGDMSLVGPRPLPVDESQACESWQQRRLDVTPGLTCIWQVKGRSRTKFVDWVRMDMQYIRGRSMWQDLKLLILTIPAVILRRGAH